MSTDNGLNLCFRDGFKVDSEKAKGYCSSMPDARKTDGDEALCTREAAIDEVRR